MSRRILLLTGDHLAAYHWRRGRLGDPIVFTAQESDLARFASYLERDADTGTQILVDLVEEEFREENIPHVRGTDRRALVRSKLGRVFRDPTYSHALFQGREREGRRDDRLLCAALVRPELLAPWVDAIAKHRVPLAGIYSLPIISRQLLRPLGVESTHALVVTRHSAGVRQSFFVERRLRLSRLARLPRVDRAGEALHVLGEVEKVRRYLASLGLTPEDRPLDAFLVGDSSLLEETRRHLPDSHAIGYRLHSLEELARKLGVSVDHRSPYADRLFVQVLASRRQSNHYARPVQTRHHTLVSTRNALRLAAAAALGTSVAWSSTKLAQGMMAARDTQSVERQAARFDERYRRARERLPPAPAGAEEMRQAVELVRILDRRKASPLSMMRVISAALDDFPRLHVDELRWESDRAREALVSARSVRSADGRSSNAGLQIAQVKGRVEPFAGDYRAALELVGRFAERLRRGPGVREVRVLTLPLDIGPEQKLRGDASVKATAGSAPFELRVALRARDHEA